MTVVTAGPQLPVDSGGKVTGAFQFSTGPVIYLPAGVIVDDITGVGAQVTANRELVTVGRTPTAVTATWTSATAVNTAAEIDCTGMSTVTISLRNNSGTYTAGQVAFECSDDGGTTWYSVLATRVALGESGHFGTLTGDGNAAFTLFASNDYVFKVDCAGFTNVQLKLTQAITGTGSTTVRLTASAAASTKPATNAIVGSAGGTAVSTSAVSGDGIDFQFNIGLDTLAFNWLYDPVSATWSRQRAKVLPTGADGLPAVPVWLNAVQLLSYDVAARNIASGALTANTVKAMLSIEHSAASTKTVRIRRIFVHAMQTTALAGMFEIEINKGTAASTGGTALTPNPRKGGDAASEAVVKSLPTITAATLGDQIPGGGFATTTTLYSAPMLCYDFQEGGELKPLTLRAGVLESIVIGVISPQALNLTMAISMDFTEE